MKNTYRCKRKDHSLLGIRQSFFGKLGRCRLRPPQIAEEIPSPTGQADHAGQPRAVHS